MRNVLSITRMSAADAVALNEKIQVAVTDAVALSGEQLVSAAVIDAAASLAASTKALEQIEGATFELRREVDTAADRCLGAIIGRAEGLIAAYESPIVPLTETQQQRLDAARWILSRCFPYGRAFIIGRWSEQFGITEMILKTAAEPEALPYLETLAVTDLFDLLQKTHTIYGQRMGFTALTPDDTDSPLYRWHESLESYLGAVIYAQNKNPDLKAKLTAPYETSAQAVRDARRRPAVKTETLEEPAA